MAKVKIAVTLDGIRGTIGGIVFSENSSGAYAKQLKRPVPRNSSYQQAFRQNLADVGYHWDDLTDGQRADWDAFAANPNELDYDPWSVQRFLTGYQWFARCAQRRLYVDAVWPTDAPTGAAQTPMADLALTAEPFPAGATEVSWSGPHLTATDALIVEFGLNTHPYATTPQTPYLIVAAPYDTGDGPYDISLISELRFGHLVAGQKAFIRAFNQAEAGNRSLASLASVIITTP
jgi:hypothetical protein